MSAFKLGRTWAVAGLLGLTACESDLSNEVFAADEAFLNAVPRRAMLRLESAPASGAEGEADEAGEGALEAAARALGPETAELYRVTRDVTWSIDHQILGTLRAVEEITARPPTTRTDDTRVWGPFREALSPVEARFVMSREADERITYAFEQRTPGGEFRPAVQGAFTASDGHFGLGEFTLDLGAFGGQGRIAVDFDRHAGGVDFAMDVEQFVEGAAATPADARYVAHRAEDGAGALTFVHVTEDGARWDLKSRWRADGAGRADARITDAGGAGGVVTECWDADFTRVYALGDVESGDAGDCVFVERSLPETDFAKSAFGSGDPGVSK